MESRLYGLDFCEGQSTGMSIAVLLIFNTAYKNFCRPNIYLELNEFVIFGIWIL